ncbi:hypothetical protein SAMN00120144_0867 [Hymenobacter roseosalivarius DSM 11622]|uniref:DUF2975 domain-containing protein n=1 Tax=Hymenobacter roseosalivarius DSM 11622 TaxID=645990 RepID=A0A1W1V6K0_9BACT|nr:DUF2975 domain-containing protein [Hymenobacter roseosalivarius]SMB89008.1 hypothetical protein SAMN00120144_0867 [Hymenobacter roseosalivarius DSM 11622]
MPFSVTLASIRPRAFLLLYMGTAQLLIFVGAVSYNFWRSDHIVVLNVQAHKIAADQPHLSTHINSPVGAYLTGTQGTLLYQTTSFWDHLLLYRLGDMTLMDALFGFVIGVYLFRVLLGLRAGYEFSSRLSRAITIIGGLTVAMHFIKSACDMGIKLVFEARIQHLFFLATPPASFIYLILGSVLLICAQLLRRSQELQHETNLTI